MPRRRRIARGTNITRVAAAMEETTEKVGKERYRREFVQRGLPRFEYYLELVLPYVHHLATDPNLSKEQRQAAVKEFFRRYREGLDKFLTTLALEAKKFAITYQIAVAERAKKPPGMSPMPIV